jgi:DNA-binding response OmpR family regulator
MRILIVEDEKILSKTIKRSLENEYEIDQAYDGAEAELYALQDIYSDRSHF